MKPKIVLGLLLAAAIFSGGIILLKQSQTPRPVAVEKSVPANAAAELAPTPAPVAEKKTMTEAERKTFVDQECNRLSSLAMNNDSESLSNILADLYSPEKEIRRAAIEAAKQFESTNAIPALKAAAAATQDNDEAMALLQAIDWLQIPSANLSALMANPQLTAQQQQARQQNAQKAAVRRAAKNLTKNINSPSSQTTGDAGAATQTPASGN